MALFSFVDVDSAAVEETDRHSGSARGESYSVRAVAAARANMSSG